MSNKFQFFDNYGFRYMPQHLIIGEQYSILQGILTDYDWLKSKLDALGIEELISDYLIFLQDQEDSYVDHIKTTLELSRSGLQQDRNQLASQLLGRLHFNINEPTQGLIDQITSKKENQLELRILNPSLRSPDGIFLQSLIDNNFKVTSILIIDACSIIVSGDSGGFITIWNLVSNNKLKSFKAHSSAIVSLLKISNCNGDFVVSVDSNGNIFIWDLAQWSIVKVLNAYGLGINKMVSSDDGKIAASILSSGALYIWDLVLYRDEDMLRGIDDDFLQRAYGGAVKAIAITSNGKRLVSLKERGLIELYDFEQNKIDILGADKIFANESAIALSKSGEVLFIGNTIINIDKWHEDELDPKSKMGVQDILLVNDELAFIISGAHGRLINWKNGQHVLEIKNIIPVNNMAVSTDGSFLYSASFNSIKVWNLNSKSIDPPQLRKSSHSGPILWITLIPALKLLVTASYDGTLKSWDLDTLNEINTFIGHSNDWWVSSVTSMKRGKYLVSVGADNTLRIWDTLSSEEVKKISLGFNFPASIVVPNDSSLAIIGFQRDFGQKGDLEIWNLDNSNREHVLMEMGGWRGIALSQNSEYLFCGNDNGEIVIFELSNMKIQTKFKAHSDRIFSIIPLQQDKIIISSGGDGFIKIWNWTENQLLQEIHAHDDVIYSLAISKKNNFFVSTSADSSIKVWDLTNYSLIASFNNDVGITASIVLDDNRIIIGDDTGFLHSFILRNING